MSLDIKKFAKALTKINWAKDGKIIVSVYDFQGDEISASTTPVEVIDVDLKAKLSLNEPLTANVTYKENGQTKIIEGVYWYKNIRPESVSVDGVALEGGSVGFSGKYKFPFNGEAIVKFRSSVKDSDKERITKFEFVVKGKCGLDTLSILSMFFNQ